LRACSHICEALELVLFLSTASPNSRGTKQL